MKFIDLEAQQRRIRANVDQRIGRVLDHGRYLLGPEVAELERRLARYAGAQHAITVGSGTDALLIALMALDVGPGDEVITSPFGFVATAEVIRLLGARPVYCDIEPDTWLIDPRLLDPLITARTRAIVPVDLYGQCADYTDIGRIARRYRIPVLADAAQSFGASQRGRRAGTLATLTATSFYPSKPLGAYGDGGAVFTDDDALAASVIHLRDHGREKHALAVRVGLHAQLDTLQCAVLLAKLDVFEDELRRRRTIAHAYDRRLGGHVRTPVLLPWNDSTWAHYTIEVEHRDAVQQVLHYAGVPTRLYYRRPLHMEPAYAGEGQRAICPIAERAAHHVLSLPMHPYLEGAEQIQICDELLNVLTPQGVDAAPGPGTPVAPPAEDRIASGRSGSAAREPPCATRRRRIH